MMKRKIVVPFLSALSIVFFSCKDAERKKTHFPNDLKNTYWIINSGGLITLDGEQIYDLSKRIDTALILNFHAIDFLDEGKFKSYDSWECGNDCFTAIYGRYYFTEANQIKMEVDSISTSGTCLAPTQIFKPSKEMVFDLTRQGEHLQLKRKNK